MAPSKRPLRPRGPASEGGEVGGQIPPPIQPDPGQSEEESYDYSRAFENIVEGTDDIVGLLAYALFKQSVREEIRQGGTNDSASRNPTRSTVQVFRMAAEQKLAEVINGGIEQATPEISQNATTAAIAGLESELKAHVTQRTGFGSAFLTNILAWAATLAIAAMILFLANRPSVEQAVAGALGKSEAPTAQQVQKK